MSEREFEESARLFAAGQISRRRFIKRLVAGGASVAAAVAFADVTAAGAFGRWGKSDWGHGHTYGDHYGKPYGKPCDDHVYGGHHGHKGKPEHRRPPKHDGPPEHHWPPAEHGPPKERGDSTSFWARWSRRKR